jgi:hypothetical protein
MTDYNLDALYWHTDDEVFLRGLTDSGELGDLGNVFVACRGMGKGHFRLKVRGAANGKVDLLPGMSFQHRQ